MNFIEEQVANMSDAELAEVCGGNEPARRPLMNVGQILTLKREEIVTDLLEHVIGEDMTREGLQETPKRVVKAWAEWTAGYNINPAELLKTFEDGAEGVEELVIVKDIPFYSHCEHHLAPFFGTVSIGYVPNGKIVGLSKLGRLSDCFAKRLQVQERYTNQIATAIFDVLQPKFVGVVASARHMCIESRGAKQCGSSTTTSAFRGDMNFRSDFLGMIK